ncbi:MAG: S8 family serine peptidase [Bacteroidales bacterium]|nr:S8 family serine peptidase [Bacteroidales bacterium]
MKNFSGPLIRSVLKPATGLISIIFLSTFITSIQAQNINESVYIPKTDIKNFQPVDHDKIYEHIVTTEPCSITPVQKKIIVQFKGESIADIYKKGITKTGFEKEVQRVKVNQDHIFKLFESDITKTFKRGTSGGADFTIKPVLEQEYRKLYFGQAVKVDSMMIPEILQLPYVKNVYPDKVAELYLHESVSQINVDSIWNELECEGDGIRVGIIDTGIDYNHPALGEGFGSGYKVAGGYDFINEDNDPIDDNSHGTHVAGIIAGDNDSIRGVAPNATLYALKVLDAQGYGNFSDIMSAVEYSVDPDNNDNFSDKLDVVNMSLGGYPSEEDPLADAVENAVFLGVTYCIAAGNDGRWGIGSPGCSPSVITVGAVDKNDSIAYFSSLGPTTYTNLLKPDVVAPGIDIYSSIINGEYQKYNGTSMSCPHVTGVCALLKKLHPDWDPGMVKSSVMSTATDLGLFKTQQGAGLVNAYKAAQVNTFINKPVISFGENTLRNNAVWTSTRSIMIFNSSDSDLTYSFNIPNPVQGIDINFSDNNFIIASGYEYEVYVTITVENSLLETPPPQTHSGYIDIYSGSFMLSEGDKNYNINWYFVKGIKITVEIDDNYNLFVITNGVISANYGLYEAVPDKFMLPDGEYTVIAEFYESLYGNITEYPDFYYKIINKVIIKSISTDSDTVISVSNDDAVNRIVFATEDENGSHYTDNLLKWRVTGITINDSLHYELSNFTDPDPSLFFAFYFKHFSNNNIYSQNRTWAEEECVIKSFDTLYISNLNDNMKISVGETRLHLGEEYTFCHNATDPFYGFHTDFELTGNAKKYKMISFSDPEAEYRPEWAPKLYQKENDYKIGWSFMTIYLANEDPLKEFNIYMPSDEDPVDDHYYQFSLYRKIPSETDESYDVKSISSPLRCVNNSFYFGNENTPDKLYFNPGDTITYGKGIYYQRSVPNNNDYPEYCSIIIGIKNYGPFNEDEVLNFPIRKWTLYNEENTLIDSAEFQGFAFSDQEPGKYKVKTENPGLYTIYDMEGVNTLNMHFDLRNEDPDPPYLSSIYSIKTNGKQDCIFEKSDTVIFRFAVSDIDIFRNGDKIFKPVVNDSTSIMFKEHFSGEWTCASIDSISYDDETGIIYQAHFEDTNYDIAYLDLKISAADEAGNCMEQIWSPAVFIKDIIPPVAYDDEYSVIFSRSFRTPEPVTINDENGFGKYTELEAEIVDSTKYGHIVLYEDGYAAYRQSREYFAVDSFTYRVKNEKYKSNTATVKFNVQMPNALYNSHVDEEMNFSMLVYPNPAVDDINIHITSSGNEKVCITMYDLSGQKIAIIYNGYLNTGNNHIGWNLHSSPGINIKNGLYIIKVQGDSFTNNRKVTIL